VAAEKPEMGAFVRWQQSLRNPKIRHKLHLLKTFQRRLLGIGNLMPMTMMIYGLVPELQLVMIAAYWQLMMRYSAC
jgi:hypothetical protein